MTIMALEQNKANYANLEPREYQLYVKDALNLRLIDLMNEHEGQRHLSRADIILIYTLYPGGIEEFLNDYLNFVKTEQAEKGFTVIKKPHYYLKDIIG